MNNRIVINNHYNSYCDSMWYFTTNVLRADDEEYGHQFYEEFADYLDGTKFPCDTMILNPFMVYGDEFTITFKFRDTKVCWCKFSVDQYGIFAIKGANYIEDCIKEWFHRDVIEKYIGILNRRVVEAQEKKCGIKDDNEIAIDRFDDYKKSGSTTLKGSIQKIFHNFTSMNETFKYCNGTHYSFADKDVEKLYRMFTSAYNGNYFLDIAVEDGRLID